MEIEVAQSIQQTTFDQYEKMIKEKASSKAEIATKIMIEILEHPSLNTFSEFLHLKEIDEVI